MPLEFVLLPSINMSSMKKEKMFVKQSIKKEHSLLRKLAKVHEKQRIQKFRSDKGNEAKNM